MNETSGVELSSPKQPLFEVGMKPKARIYIEDLTTKYARICAIAS